MTSADNMRATISKQLLHCLRQYTDCGSIRLLDKQVSRIRMFKSKFNKIYRFVQVHQKTCHFRIGDGNRLAVSYLVNKKRNHRSPGAHHISISCTADHCLSPLRRHPGICSDHMFHHGLAGSHGVDGIGRLVSRKTHHLFYACLNSGMEHIIGSLYIGINCLHWEKLTGRHLL